MKLITRQIALIQSFPNELSFRTFVNYENIVSLLEVPLNSPPSAKDGLPITIPKRYTAATKFSKFILHLPREEDTRGKFLGNTRHGNVLKEVPNCPRTMSHFGRTARRRGRCLFLRQPGRKRGNSRNISSGHVWEHLRKVPGIIGGGNQRFPGARLPRGTSGGHYRLDALPSTVSDLSPLS